MIFCSDIINNEFFNKLESKYRKWHAEELFASKKRLAPRVIITRRKPSDKFMEVAETVGLIIVLGLVILANGNDIIRLFR